MVTLRFDKTIPVATVSDRIILLLLSAVYSAYRVYCKMILRVPRKMYYTAFIRKILPKRKFLLRSPANANILFYCRAGHEMDNLILGNYEDKVRLVFVPEPHDTIVDVGAHLGEYTIPCAKIATRVISIEPNTDVLEILKENIRVNALSNVVTVNRAVYDSHGHRSLNLFEDRTGMSSIVIDQCEDRLKTLEVEADTLDNILSDLQIDKVDWIKVDVEGAEVNVLRGAKGIISSNLDNIRLIIECHSNETIKEVIRMIIIFGMAFRMLDDHHIFAYHNN